MAVDKASQTLAVTVNGVNVSTRAHDLAELVAQTQRDDGRVATAVNGRFVAIGARATTVLSHGDTVEILSARQGG